MNTASFNGAGIIDFTYQINRDGDLDFVFRDGVTDDTTGITTYTDEDVTTSTWELFIKRYKGDREKLIDLTLGSGLSFPVYTTNTVNAAITAVQSRVEEGEYWLELYNITTKQTRVAGRIVFSYFPDQLAR